jgi:acetone carboxylase gamma subunit
MSAASPIQITEYLGVDLRTEAWLCLVCGHDLGSARGDYKQGCLVAARNPLEVHNPGIVAEAGQPVFAPDPEWVRIVEFYCPGCATLVEVEYLPPGHPLTHDIELDVDALKARFA